MEKKSEDGVCLCTPSSNWKPLHVLPRNGSSNVSARKLAAHLYWDTFPTCNQVPRHYSTTTHQVASCSFSDTASLTSTRIHAREPTRKVLNGMRKLKDLRTYDLNEQQIHEAVVKRSILECHVSKHCKPQSESLITIQALEREVDDERRRRKRLESLNRKLSVEIDDVKLLVTSTLKELENESRSCEVLEDLCEKFAKAILNRQSEVTSAKPRTLKELKLTCRMAEAWLDKRTRTYQAHDSFISGKQNSETEAEASQKEKFSVGVSSSPEERSLYRRSYESFLVNEHGNQIPEHEDNSTENDLYCFGQQKWTASRKGAGSSTGAEQCSAMKPRRMVKNPSRNYSADISEHKKQSSGIRSIFTASSSPMHQLRSNLTTSHVNQKQCSLGSYLLEARKRPQYCKLTRFQEQR